MPERSYIAKPVLSTQGRGIFKVMDHEVAERVDFSSYILQPLLVNPPALARVAGPGAGLCTLRVNTIGTKYGEARVFGSFLRLARAGSLIDNFHAGGIACPVDLRTATVKAGAIEENKRERWREVMSLRVHPNTGVTFADEFRVPYFNEALALCESAHRKMGPELLFCSWDVALTEDGPLLVEAGSCLAGALEMLHRPDVRLYMDTLRERVAAMPEFVARSRRVESSSCLEMSFSTTLGHKIGETIAFACFGWFLTWSRASGGGDAAPWWPTSIPFVFQVMLAFVIWEFGLYWNHRFMHGWAWRIHSLHHKLRRLSWINSGYGHPMNFLLTSLFSYSALYFSGAPVDVLSFSGYFSLVINFLSHANIDVKMGYLNLILNTPELHRWLLVRSAANDGPQLEERQQPVEVAQPVLAVLHVGRPDGLGAREELWVIAGRETNVWSHRG
ncbi:sugar-transfer associated ATP-grasp domain-containing protein [Archangium sp.]|uniref:sugar-transfer associated ATP-grasp domain-containing protein n=1 Tax=Archangium sp. TaxID=1872627 RepID=UPI002D445F49|nr:sugar-transfer associated ATP-grasp domain-containing protein [Archangium sp.]HYO56046.1 sugar-transfer associated ATP-grasp domain-containing protein [Archangium sp.]